MSFVFLDVYIFLLCCLLLEKVIDYNSQDFQIFKKWSLTIFLFATYFNTIIFTCCRKLINVFIYKPVKGYKRLNEVKQTVMIKGIM